MKLIAGMNHPFPVKRVHDFDYFVKVKLFNEIIDRHVSAAKISDGSFHCEKESERTKYAEESSYSLSRIHEL
jgi:hypothetical protein